MFQLCTTFTLSEEQRKSVEKLSEAILDGKKSQVLLGVTGSGKTFTMANVIAKVGRPSLVLAHNKTLAAQLFQEFRAFFPNNAVEYFVSYYDYYQPEAYIARTDTYIEKDMAVNDRIDRLRLSATRSLIEREDVIIVASVSCIYGLGLPEYYKDMRLVLNAGDSPRRDELLLHLVEMQYTRNDYDFSRGEFRVRGDNLEVFPSYEESLALRFEFFGDELERISEIDPLTGKVLRRVEKATIYPSSHHVTPEEVRQTALVSIREELKERVAYYEVENKLLERERIQQRTCYDLEMLKEVGTCKGIENYSRHFSRRKAGEPPPCLLDYFPENYLIFVDESHQTIPQVRAMYNGDRARKSTLVDFGFRLPSAFDNRPLKFEEFYEKLHAVIYVSATPAPWEVAESGGEVVEQLLRPTGLLDPPIEVRPAATQVDDCLEEIRVHTKKGGRVLVTTLTKRLAEELSKYLEELGVKAKYLHSDIDTLERMQIIQDLRCGEFDVLVGINLLREGLDIPEVSLIAILDADKEGFLRSTTALVQTCGRASRNVDGRVLMYADKMTRSMQECITITETRRKKQREYNEEHGIIPRTIKRELGFDFGFEKEVTYSHERPRAELRVAESSHEYLTMDAVRNKIKEYEKLMQEAAKDLRFEDAAHYRDEVKKYQMLELTL